MKRLSITPQALKALPALPPKHYRQVVGAILDLLADSRPHYSKPLVNSDYLRLAVGEYRVIYRADDEAVYVSVLGKRNDDEVYRILDRQR